MGDTEQWTAEDVGDQSGRVAVVTGASSGIGLEVAKVLAASGARLVLPCRDDDRFAQTGAAITEAVGESDLDGVAMDLRSLDSVREAADVLRERYARIDLLINNAGVMWMPRGRSTDGYDTQLAVNHLGHFALTGLLLDRLRDVEGSRVVTVSSLAHRGGRIRWSDLNFERGYGRNRAYGQSKLANLMFSFALQRRLQQAGSPTISVAAHPGVARTGLLRNAPAILRGPNVLVSRFMFADAAMGALPILYAAVAPNVEGGGYYGPGGFAELRGYPTTAHSSTSSRDQAEQGKLWRASESLTGVTYELG
ncbi:MAG TPA: oxidoreductase [Stackebrandtia sp.]|jgi:NAD(P)-dependent dehydrogenase (short-subunit alcohol dehydrogenase family)|uniref:oxidoreductase n=1 Tax=Stackebrandtia sp. TaxID=2023065 RepID=UPI002D27DB84|nr:oxidoreductase [Stackebrandtia sp.]HZE37685.1 oxidoreductase [Stackebrandtia sp.]